MKMLYLNLLLFCGGLVFQSAARLWFSLISFCVTTHANRYRKKNSRYVKLD